MTKRETFGSSFGVLAAAAGSAIGLGNIWKFPYITGENGGAAFVLVYLICIALVGVPVMFAELLIGRRTQSASVGAFKALAPKQAWFVTGWFGVLAAFMILSFYGVVAGWTLNYTYLSVTNQFAGATPEQIGQMFDAFITNGTQPIFWQMIFMAMTAFIVLSGVKDGIEKYSKIMMPMLFLIVVILAIRGVTLDGASKGIDFLLTPDFSKLTTQSVLVALGHCFFTLSLGMGAMLVYGSYTGKTQSLGKLALQVTLADTAIALLAGLAIFPAVFAFGVNPGQGPGLAFVTLPNVFNQMPGGYFFAIAFFVLLAVAALTSAISLLEVLVTFLCEEFKFGRIMATIVATLTSSVLGVLCALSKSPTSGISKLKFPTLAGPQDFFDTMDWWSSNMLLPLGGLLMIVFAGWFMKPADVLDELSSQGLYAVKWFKAFQFAARFIAPIAIVVVLVAKISGKIS